MSCREQALQHGALQLRAVAERDVARAVDAAGDGAVDLARGDAVRELRRGGEAGAAGALQVVGRRLGMQARSRACIRAPGSSRASA